MVQVEIYDVDGVDTYAGRDSVNGPRYDVERRSSLSKLC